MAKTPRFSTGLRDAMLEPTAANVALDVFNGGTLKIYTGTQPATADEAPTGTLLVTITLPTPAFAAASGGARAKAGTWSGTAGATATAGWFRIATSADTGVLSTTEKRMDGQMGTSASDLVLASLAITSGDVITVDTFPVSIPAS